MSERKGKGYKSWLDRNSKTEDMPRSTKYDHRKRKLNKLNDDILVINDSDTDSDSTVHSDDNKNIFIEEHGNEHIDSEPIHKIPSNLSEPATCMEIECHINEEQDWINTFMGEQKPDSQEDEEEIQLHRNRKSERKFNRNVSYLNERVRATTNTSNGEIILMCMLLGVRHSLTWGALSDIITMINKLFDKDIIQMSKYKLLNFFPDRIDWFSYHIYCSQCKHYLGNRSEIPSVVTCVSCQFVINNTKEMPYFLILNIKSQLKELLENPLVQPHLNYRFNHKQDDNIEDVMDGDLHKLLSQPGNILFDKNNFSYILNTDGCQASDSSPVSIWPVFLKINELPPSIRDDHIILAGLWVNEKKPTMNLFLPPLINHLNDLESEGVNWKKDNEIINSKFIALACCVDSVCRCSMLNMKQFNGHYGCTFCYHPTEEIDGFRKYPMNNNFYPLRTHSNIMRDMFSTQTQDKVTGNIITKEVSGVLGISALINLKHFNLANRMTPDSMHCVYLGVIKQYTEMILSSYKKPYYVGSPVDLGIINKRLLSIKPPTCITRTPRSLSLRSSWKASEWRSWLLYYCIQCLQGVLDVKYLTHLSKLVSGIEILLRDSISRDDIKVANKLLITFVIELETLYGKDQMTYNVHLLLHIPKSAKNLGPLYLHDAFCFENQNRLLLNMKTSPTEMAVQIANRYFFYRSIPLFSTYFTLGYRVLEFYDNLEPAVKSFIKVEEAVLIGKGKNYIFNEKEQHLHFFGSSLTYEKLIYKRRRITTANYVKNFKINDSIIETHDGNKGVVSNICLLNNDDERKIAIFYYPLQILNNYICNIRHMQHIKECFVDYTKLCVCAPEHIKNQCIIIQLGTKMCVSPVIQGSLGD